MFELLSLDFATLTGTFRGSFVFVASNGDRLKCNYRGNPDIPGTGTFSGIFNPADGTVVVTFIQEFVPVPEESTGKFATVTGGSFIMITTSKPFPLTVNEFGYTPPFEYSWVGDGTLEFANGKKPYPWRRCASARRIVSRTVSRHRPTSTARNLSTK